MARITIIGGHGKVALRLARLLSERGDQVAAWVRNGDHAVDVGDGAIAAPMPGTVLDVRVEPGDLVAAGDVLGVLEAMKMELSLKAPFDGIVRLVHATAGDQVALGDRLFLVETDEAAETEED